MVRFVFLLSFLSILACKSHYKQESIDEFIKKYEFEKFEDFKNISISVRGTDGVVTKYVLSKYGGKTPVYFVSYNSTTHSIVEINNSALISSGISDYFSEEDINRIVNTFQGYNFYLLSVDNEGNVFINPFKFNAPPFFLKLKTPINQKIIKNGYVYSFYNKNWYINNYFR